MVIDIKHNNPNSIEGWFDRNIVRYSEALEGGDRKMQTKILQQAFRKYGRGMVERIQDATALRPGESEQPQPPDPER